MDGYDILMIAILAGTTLFGAMKGMTWQLASLGSLVLSYFVAYHFSAPLVNTGLFGITAPWNRFAAMLAIYTATGAIVWLMFRRVSQSIETFKMRDFDRQLGAIFGLFKGVMLCIAVTFFVVALLPDYRPKVLSSYSGQYIARMLGKADKVMPAEWLTVLRPYLDQLEDKFNEGQPTNGLPATNNSSWPVSSPNNGYTTGYPGSNGQQSRGAGSSNEPRPLLDFLNQSPQNPVPQYQSPIPAQPYAPPYQSQPIPNTQYNPGQQTLNQQVYSTTGLQPIVDPMYSGNPAYQPVVNQYPQPNYQQTSYPQQPYAQPVVAQSQNYPPAYAQSGYPQQAYPQSSQTYSQQFSSTQQPAYAASYPPGQPYTNQHQSYPQSQPYSQSSYDMAQRPYNSYNAQYNQYPPQEQPRQYQGPIESPSVWKWAELATPTENRYY